MWKALLFEQYRRQCPDGSWVKTSLYDDLLAYASKSLHNEDDAMSACNDALERLSADNFAALGDGAAIANPRAWLMTAFKNAITDFQRRMFLRCRPDEWCRARGERWITIHRLFCCERKSIRDIADEMVLGPECHEALERTVKAIKRGHNECPIVLAQVQSESADQSDGGSPSRLENAAIDAARTESGRPDRDVEGAQYELLVDSVWQVFSGSPAASTMARRVEAALNEANLTARESAAFRLIKVEDFTQAQAGAALGISTPTVNRAMKSALAKLSTTLEPLIRGLA